MAVVYLATDLKLERPVALKVLRPELAEGIGSGRFVREVLNTANLQHRHIVPLFDAGTVTVGEQSLHYYSMPYVIGESLRLRIARGERMSIADATRLASEVADALDHAHAHGIIHRDIKPENILLADGHALVADFGISRAVVSSGARTGTGIMVGTPAYAAPEQAAADPNLDARADLYSLGVVLYELLAGGPPFEGTPSQLLAAHLTRSPEPIAARRPDISPALAVLVMDLLEKDPTRRPQRAGTVRDALRALTQPSSEGQSSPDGGTGGSGAGASRLPRRATIGALAGVALAIAMWFALRPPVSAAARALAITPLVAPGGDSALVRLGQQLVILLAASLDGVGDLRVTDGVAMIARASRHGALLTLEQALRVGRELGARSVVAGSLTEIGDVVRAELGVYALEDPDQPIVRVTHEAPRGDSRVLADSLAWKLLAGIWRGSEPPPPATSLDTRSPAALRDYLDGEEAFSQGRTGEASDLFKSAATIDSTFLFAHFRYVIARAWNAAEAETTLTHRLVRHRERLATRERDVLDAYTARGLPSFSGHLRFGLEVAARYPDFGPALLAGADFLVHDGAYLGADAGEAAALFERIVTLNPQDEEMVSHLAFACAVGGDHVCARTAAARSDSMRSARVPMRQAVRAHTLSIAIAEADTRAERQEIARVARRDSVVPTLGIALPMFGALLAERPRALVHWDTVVAMLGSGNGALAASAGEWSLLSRTFRGDVAALDSLRPRARAGRPRVAIEDQRRLIRLTLLQEVQGLRPPNPETAREILRLAREPDAVAIDTLEAHWIAGMNALLLADTVRAAAAASALGALASRLDSSSSAIDSTSGVVAASFSFLRQGWAGDRAVAGDSLRRLEARWADSRTIHYIPTVLAIDRLLAATWLAEAGAHASADSLLRLTRTYLRGYEMPFGAIQSVFPAAQLVRSRIAEATGDPQQAIAFARIFLASFDRAGASGEASREEARARIRRLGGEVNPDAVASPSVRTP